MEHAELLRYVVSVLERLGLDYLVTGSVATIFYGEPRFTNDIDVVVCLSEHRIGDFCQAFPATEFYLSEAAVREAVQRRSQFNIIQPNTGLKVDVIVPPDTPFNRSRFARATSVRPAEDYEARFASLEDVILKKLEYFREGGSEKHLRDIASALRIRGERVDRQYISEWAAELGLEDIWHAVKERLDAS